MKIKRLLAVCLAALMLFSAMSVSVSAAEIAPLTDTTAVEKYFPEGIPDYLTADEVQTVLNGEYLSIVVDDEVITYNPESNPLYTFGTRSTNAEWDEDLTKSNTWWPEYGRLTYTVGGNYTVATRYFIGNQDQSSGSWKGRSFCEITLRNGATNHQQNESVHSPLIGSKYVDASCSISNTSPTDYLRFAYRNLITDWNRGIRIY